MRIKVQVLKLVRLTGEHALVLMPVSDINQVLIHGMLIPRENPEAAEWMISH
jgi:hypothetical protein